MITSKLNETYKHYRKKNRVRQVEKSRKKHHHSSEKDCTFVP